MRFSSNFGVEAPDWIHRHTYTYPRAKATNELTEKLKNLIISCRENLQNAQKLQKQVHNKRPKPKSYVFSEKILLNSKYIKIKYNRNLEAMFFGFFQVLYPMGS